MKNVREVALEGLITIEKNQAYSNLLLNNYLESGKLNKKDAGLFTEIVYGTIQRSITLEYVLAPYIQKQKKLQDWVKNLLKMTMYQMIYLDKVPARAAIYEAVEIAKKRGHKGVASVVNGVLRSIQRNGVPDLTLIEDDAERISVVTSHPKWLVEKWMEQYGVESTEKMCEINLVPPSQTARVNTCKSSVNEVLEMLNSEGFSVQKGTLAQESIVSEKGNMAFSNAYKNGYITIQDESSMLVAKALGVEKGDNIYDCCAAPGGKSTHIAEELDGTGMVTSTDLHEHKVRLIKEQATRLGISNLQAQSLDSRRATSIFKEEQFDKVLVDAPCSGLGVIRRKPDLKYTKTLKDIIQLASIQLAILNEVAPLVKKGGTLVYSTCTIDKEENGEVVQSFLKENKDFEIDINMKDLLPKSVGPYINDGMLQLLPHHFGTDGFFIVRLKRQV
ncbi:16S rRNA (cytosine(967)-C(5))-methyltransferase RsmB [Sutcliffiella rhizosphaerae]|uniref:16S rRNA (cytosine(967)-C(5))-methyltransferase n=1 Tax=Sutcliffiella rhizosphaerae TaxID=2880967 RepID=A0ABN8A9I0_9BACI|nr:16S rRNA (cytosine(967)-C(5))-methyltransferase RsmB [Sutcliffiella rhizosphaerae]CAG9619758.1 Ribosomal RNA small subunit methyltransferase B [Sutcliffiella rhizosphaerae]